MCPWMWTLLNFFFFFFSQLSPSFPTLFSFWLFLPPLFARIRLKLIVNFFHYPSIPFIYEVICDRM